MLAHCVQWRSLLRCATFPLGVYGTRRPIPPTIIRARQTPRGGPIVALLEQVIWLTPGVPRRGLAQVLVSLLSVLHALRSEGEEADGCLLSLVPFTLAKDWMSTFLP